MIGGISDIKKAESHRKRLKYLHRARRGCFLSEIMHECDISGFCNEEKCNYINQIKEQFIINGRVPQILDIEIYKE